MNALIAAIQRRGTSWDDRRSESPWRSDLLIPPPPWQPPALGPSWSDSDRFESHWSISGSRLSHLPRRFDVGGPPVTAQGQTLPTGSFTAVPAQGQPGCQHLLVRLGPDQGLSVHLMDPSCAPPAELCHCCPGFDARTQHSSVTGYPDTPGRCAARVVGIPRRAASGSRRPTARGGGDGRPTARGERCKRHVTRGKGARALGGPRRTARALGGPRRGLWAAHGRPTAVGRPIARQDTSDPPWDLSSCARTPRHVLSRGGCCVGSV